MSIHYTQINIRFDFWVYQSYPLGMLLVKSVSSRILLDINQVDKQVLYNWISHLLLTYFEYRHMASNFVSCFYIHFVKVILVINIRIKYILFLSTNISLTAIIKTYKYHDIQIEKNNFLRHDIFFTNNITIKYEKKISQQIYIFYIYVLYRYMFLEMNTIYIL